MVKVYETTNNELVLEDGELMNRPRTEYVIELEKEDDANTIVRKLFDYCNDATYYGRVISRIMKINMESLVLAPRYIVAIKPDNSYDGKQILCFIKDLLERQQALTEKVHTDKPRYMPLDTVKKESNPRKKATNLRKTQLLPGGSEPDVASTAEDR